MSGHENRAFPRWEELYQEAQVESMYWFNPELDDDLKEALEELELRGGSVLDLGTGPGTQAMQLARRGFMVTATDISGTAIGLARAKAEKQGLDITWKEDNILATRLDRSFDFIFDRGCFHVLTPERRLDYVMTVARLLKTGGYLFLKCFSNLQPGEQGPYRFSPERIREIFGDWFDVLAVKETVYQGTLNPLPRALFSEMRRKTNPGTRNDLDFFSYQSASQVGLSRRGERWPRVRGA